MGSRIGGRNWFLLVSVQSYSISTYRTVLVHVYVLWKKYTFDDDFGGSYTFDDSESQPTLLMIPPYRD
eukprot:COSAG01_NODE_73274_length_249_cov_2.593333_1_plen_67_part_01